MDPPVHLCDHHGHLRFTPNDEILHYDLSGLIQNLGAARYALVYEYGVDNHEDFKKRSHYHLYFELTHLTCEKTVRNLVIEKLGIPTVGRGRTNKHYCLKFDKYTDPSAMYLFKDRDDGVIKDQRGYPEAEIARLKAIANQRWPKTQTIVVTAPQSRIFLENANAPQTKTQTEWQKLYCAALDRKNFKQMSMQDWGRFIKHYYLKDERPIPRAGDIQRYQYSLYAILQNKTDYSDIRELDEMADI